MPTSMSSLRPWVPPPLPIILVTGEASEFDEEPRELQRETVPAVKKLLSIFGTALESRNFATAQQVVGRKDFHTVLNTRQKSDCPTSRLNYVLRKVLMSGNTELMQSLLRPQAGVPNYQLKTAERLRKYILTNPPASLPIIHWVVSSAQLPTTTNDFCQFLDTFLEITGDEWATPFYRTVNRDSPNTESGTQTDQLSKLLDATTNPLVHEDMQFIPDVSKPENRENISLLEYFLVRGFMPLAVEILISHGADTSQTVKTGPKSQPPGIPGVPEHTLLEQLFIPSSEAWANDNWTAESQKYFLNSCWDAEETFEKRKARLDPGWKASPDSEAARVEKWYGAFDKVVEGLTGNTKDRLEYWDYIAGKFQPLDAERLIVGYDFLKSKNCSGGDGKQINFSEGVEELVRKYRLGVI